MMKIFNVRLQVNINELGALPDVPAEEPQPEKFNDDPLDKADKILTKHFKNLEFPRSPVMALPGDNGMSLTLNFNIIGENFEAVQCILAKFYSTATLIHEAQPAPELGQAGVGVFK